MDLDYVYSFEMPGRLVFGGGASQKAGGELRALGASKVLIVTDKGIEQAGLLKGIVGSLEAAGLEWAVFNEVEPNPTVACVDKAAARYRSEACDAVLGIGGGSSLDTAKATAILATNPGSILDYEGSGKVKNPVPPFIVMPTTCGTGSEVTFNAVITDPVRKVKFSAFSTLCVPKVALIDPVLLTGLPAHMVASTGMDALTHAVESYTTRYANPVADALNIHAIKLIGQYMRPAVANGNLEAMAHMVLASTITGMAFTNTRLTAVHAMSHPMGGHANVPHGIANAVLLPYVMEYNLMGAIERFGDIARALGEDTTGLTPMEAAEMSVLAVRKLADDIGIPRTIKELGITEDLIPAMAEDGVKMIIVELNPRRMKKQDIIDVYMRAMGS